MTPTRSPYETLRDEADAIGQRAHAASEFAAQVDRSAEYLFTICAHRAEDAVRQMRMRMLELDKAAGGATNDEEGN